MTAVALGPGLASPEALLRRLIDDRFASRLFAKDVGLWGEAARAEAAQRLGWVDAFEGGDELCAELIELRETLGSQGIDRIVLSGMGGSSLAPEVICRRDWAPLTLLDTTHPERIRAVLTQLERSVLVVSSKSGSTVETRSHLAAFEDAFRSAGIDPAERIILVTDPGSPLDREGRTAGYRVFLADSSIGGRYSAFTAFGLVPAVLAGADGIGLLREARTVGMRLSEDTAENPALRLAAALAAQLPSGYTFGVSETRVQSINLAAWIEQLIAESSGKAGRGVLPIALPQEAPELRSDAVAAGSIPSTMYRVGLSPEPSANPLSQRTIEVGAPLGAQFLLWEVATAALCRLIEVNPFDQPDVESAKRAARTALTDPARSGAAPHDVALDSASILAELREAVPQNGYVSIQAFVDPGSSLPLEDLRAMLSAALQAPVSLGIGPRYLHSTGQFHKGGPRLGAYLQIVDTELPVLGIPGQERGFDALIRAQAEGDRQVLEDLGRPVVQIGVDQARLLAEYT